VSDRQWYNKGPLDMPGTLFVVATPIGNLEDVSARALRVLRSVAVIAAEDTRRTAHLLDRYGISTATISLHAHNERQRVPELLDRLAAGEDVALVSDAGTPAISDPGAVLVRAASERGMSVSPIPGPSAVTALLSVAGLDQVGFVFLGFPPTRSKDRKLWLERLAGAVPVAVFYEGPHRILPTLDDIRRRIGDANIIVGRELTKAHEELVKGPISTVLKGLSTPKGEFVVAVEIGHSIEPTGLRAEVSSADLFLEFGHMTDSGGMTRRQAIAALSRRHGLTARDVYARLEAAKASVS
jgi:16S rRNA (cytidine1402-2'-O)-methyltransferase